MKMKVRTLLVVLATFPCLGSGVVVTQHKKLLLVTVGDSAEMTCYQDDDTYYNMFWYQQRPGEGMKLMVWSADVSQNIKMEGNYEKDWELKRSNIRNSVLHLKSARLQDAAVYFCAARQGDKLHFGDGTIVTVLEKGREKKNPNVTIFLPNPQELEQHNRISLVCVASNFYPEQAYIRWKVNGKEKEFIDQAKPITVSDTFSVSRRLSLTREEYYNPENIFRCESGFQDKENKVIYKQISGKKGCSSLTDTYRRYTNSGKYSYILILCKSALYGLIVAAVMLRKKMIRSSY